MLNDRIVFSLSYLVYFDKYIGDEKAMNPLGLGDKARERWNTNSDLGIL